ncbi:hypothetical protein llap_12341 [Limosa lapponica baueri]|uniref:Uncharacterized protein n=1 Tax=Limosa lapponica baueri TaxID=1758121 RepID=A0A2I0TU61_LIMLA|nr:hypothetical protein llap_12341 [Limosa lapponica baueri]
MTSRMSCSITFPGMEQPSRGGGKFTGSSNLKRILEEILAFSKQQDDGTKKAHHFIRSLYPMRNLALAIPVTGFLTSLCKKPESNWESQMKADGEAKTLLLVYKFLLTKCEKLYSILGKYGRSWDSVAE